MLSSSSMLNPGSRDDPPAPSVNSRVLSTLPRTGRLLTALIVTGVVIVLDSFVPSLTSQVMDRGSVFGLTDVFS